MKSQHRSAQPSRQSRTTLFKAGDPSEAQPLLHMHKPWLDTGPSPGVNPPGPQASREHAPTAQPSPWGDGPVSTLRSEALHRR